MPGVDEILGPETTADDILGSERDERRRALQTEAQSLRDQALAGRIGEGLIDAASTAAYFTPFRGTAARILGIPGNPELPPLIPKEKVQDIIQSLPREIGGGVPDTSGGEPILKGAQSFVSNAASSLTTPDSLALLATGAPGATVFGGEMIQGIPETIQRMQEASKRGDVAGVVEEAGNLGTSMLGPVGIAKGIGKSRIERAQIPQPETIPAKGEPNASEVSPTATLHGDVRPLEEPASALPPESSGEGVQLQTGVQQEGGSPASVAGKETLPVIETQPDAVLWKDLSPEIKQRAHKEAVASGNTESFEDFDKFTAPGLDWNPDGTLYRKPQVAPEPEWMGKPVSEWEKVDPSKLSAPERASLSKSLAVENKPAAIKKRIAERTEAIRKNQGLAKDVRAKLESGATDESGFVNLDVLKQIVDYGKALWSKGMDFATWSKDMISHLGEKAAQFLSKAWSDLTETKPVEAVQKFSKDVLAPDSKLSTEQANAAGMQARSLADLDHMLESRRQLGAKLRDLLKRTADPKLTDAARNELLNEAALSSGRGQIPREAIETATNSGSHVQGEGTGVGKPLGERPLDWRKNKDVAQWLRTHAQEAGIKLPDELTKPDRGLASGVRNAPALNTQAGFFSLEPIERVGKSIRDFWRSFSLQSLPKLTDSNRELGEAGVRYETSPRVARAKGIDFAERVAGPDAPKEFDSQFGTALAEDNLRGIKEGLRTESVNEAAKGNDTRAAELKAAADKVATLVGKKNSPFKTEADYQAFLNHAKTQEAIDRHIQQWEAEKDPLFRKANDLDPDAELSSRGLQTGARVNLKNIMTDEGTPTTVGPAARPTLIKQTATLLRRDPFARRAKGTGQSYEGSYRELMAHGYEREYPVAMQHDFIRKLIESGDASLDTREYPKGLEIKGEGTKGYLMKLRPWAGQFLQIRKSLAPEYESISGLTPATKIPYYSKAADFLTKQSVMGLAEGSTHVGNILTQLFTGVGPTANPMINALLKSAGRSDLLVSFPKVIIKSFSDRKADMLRLAEIGAAKEPYRGSVGWVINKVDKGTRLYASDLYRKMAEKGWVEDTETGEREFVNQVGQYSKRLQPKLMQVLRDTGTQPFATAIQTFNVQGLRNMAMGPGAKSPTNLGALALRADKAAGLIGTVVLIAALNKLVSGTASGPPGTQLGNVGWMGDDKKLHQFNVGKLSGWERGPRITGVQAGVEATRLGLSPNTALTAAGKAVAGAGLNYLTGPLVQTATKAATGKRPGVPMVQEGKVVPPSDDLAPLKSQAAENVKIALQEINPVVDTAAKVIQGKPLEDIARSQLSRYTPKTGMDAKTIEALPKIVHASELHSYVDALSKEAHKLEPSKRAAFLMKRMRDDGLKGADLGRAQLELHRKGVL